MSISPRPPIPSFLPESAPFSPQQRAWLDGLFAGDAPPIGAGTLTSSRSPT